MANIYYDPQKFDLRIVGEVDWSDGSYQFDLFVVWQRESDGAFFWGRDSGCSCPSPFETMTGPKDLDVILSLDSVKEWLEATQAEESYDRSVEVAELLERLHGAGLR